MVQPCDISKRILTKFKTVAQGSFQAHHKFPVKGIKRYLHRHPGIRTDLHCLLQGIHPFAHGKDRTSCFLFVRENTISHFH
jgi:hypothetical protein